MDVVRGTAMCLVVVFHATFFLEQYAGLVQPAWAERVNLTLTPVRIPLLVLLSGMLLGSSFAKGGRRYLSGKLRGIAWPYLVWALVWGALSWPVYSLVGFALGGSYLWFLLYLLVFYLVAWPLRRLPPELLVVAAASGSAVASVLSGGGPTDPASVERWLYLFSVFMAGHVLTRRRALLDWLLRSRWALALAAGLVLAHRALGLGFDYGTESAPLFVAGAVVVLRVARLTAQARAVRPLRFVGRHSVVFYLVHYPVMAALASAAAGLPVGPVLLLPVLVASALAVATLLAWHRHRPLVAWLFQAPGGQRRALTAASAGGR